MITIAVFDSDPANRETVRKTLVSYTMRQFTDIDVLWFFDGFETERIKKYAPLIHIALISLDFKESFQISKNLYRYNEDCRIVFYSAAANDLEPLLRFRPRAYHRTPEKESVLFDKLNEIVSEIKYSSGIFCHENKREILLIPLKSIVYFQSDLKYINIVLTNGKQERIYAKLSDIEPYTDSGFLRIHKSYFVNKRYVRSVSKTEKTVVLKNDCRLPISEANYKAVMAAFGESPAQKAAGA